jgi:hypothetical protein
MYSGDLENARRDLIRGDGVRRASHQLEWNGWDVSELFRRLLETEGYSETLKNTAEYRRNLTWAIL